MIPVALLVSLVTSVVIPGVSSFFSRQHWPAEVRALLTVVLAALSGFLATWAAAGDFHVTVAVLWSLLNYIVAAVARSQFWRESKLDAALVGNK